MKNKKKINIGIMGVSFYGANKGCEALGYSFLDVLIKKTETCNLYLNLYIFVPFTYKTYIKWILIKEYRKSIIPKILTHDVFCNLAPQNMNTGKFLTKYYIDKCDIVFDFTQGDSFTDIYGRERFFERTEVKKLVLSMNKPLILGSQTYGPFNWDDVRLEAQHVINQAFKVFSRDMLSDACVNNLCNKEVVSVTDMAFALPYSKPSKVCDNIKKKIKIGLNISGLLWCDGYTRNNQFGLMVNYKDYTYKTIDYLRKKSIYEIHIIPHVFGTAKKGIYLVDDDMIPTTELKEKYHDLIVSPVFSTPMEAKTYISNMDIFIGSRMHATIAAFSSHVATIPFSYSRKFEGLYHSFGYNYLISGTKMTTEEALKYTQKYIDSYKKLKINVDIAMKNIIEKKLYLFEEEVEKILLQFCHT